MAKRPGVNVQRLTTPSSVQAVRKRATRKQWHRIVRKAHRKGVTVESLLDTSLPMALKQRSRAGLRRQASKTIQKAYAPAELELTQQEQKVKSVDAKRTRDNAYYLDWLKSRSDQMNSAARDADIKLRDTQNDVAEDAAVQAGQARQEMMQHAAAQPGVVSDPNQAKAFDTSADDKYNADLIATQRDATNRAIGSAETRQATLDASNFAFMAASEASRQADTWSKLSELGDERQKLQLSKASDAAREVSRLFDLETNKANSNREYAAVAQRLGVQLAGVKQRDLASQRTARQNALDRKATNRRHRQDVKLKKEKQAFQQGLDEAELAISQGNLDLGWYKALHPSKGKGGSGGVGGDPMKSNDPQKRFEYGYALVASSVRQGKPRKDGTYPNKAYDRDWVSKNENLVTNQLVKKGFSRRMAKTIVNAFLQKNGREPGRVGRYRPDRHDVRGQ